MWIQNRNRTLDSDCESATYKSDSDSNLHNSDSKSDSTTHDSESGIKSGFGFVQLIPTPDSESPQVWLALRLTTKSAIHPLAIAAVASKTNPTTPLPDHCMTKKCAYDTIVGLNVRLIVGPIGQ